MRMLLGVLACASLATYGCSVQRPADNAGRTEPERNVPGDQMAKWEVARSNMQEIGKALNMSATEQAGQYPASLKEIRSMFAGKVPADPFTGRDFHYVSRGDGFVLVCLGADGQLGGLSGADIDLFADERGWLPREAGPKTEPAVDPKPTTPKREFRDR